MRLKSIIRGLLTYAPPLERLIPKSTQGTDTARYCYAVWMRHLVMAAESGLDANPKVVAELGPGDSLGIGLAALLSGTDTYYGFDIVAYASAPRNRAILNELVELYRARAPIPDPGEFPNVRPTLDAYDFPHDILTANRMETCLHPDRVAAITAALESVGTGGPSRDGISLAYRVPWNDPSAMLPESADMIYSQAVLEHVDDLPGTYRALVPWLKPGGFTSHQIGFVSHGITPEWNGHWTIPGVEWKLIRGRRPYLLNRQPSSVHSRLIAESGLEIVREKRVEQPSDIRRDQLAGRFRDMSDADLTTRAVFIQAVKPAKAE